MKREVMAREESRAHAHADPEAIDLLAESFKRIEEPAFQQKRKALETLQVKVTSTPDGRVEISGLLSDHLLQFALK